MKCYDCGGSCTNYTGNIDLPSTALGSYTLFDVTCLKCSQCGEVILPDETWELADQRENYLIDKFLFNLPVKEYIGASSAASILDISRQGLHKHRRIRRGFIYSILHEGKRLYNRKSVELYKETGDGRFLLSETTSQEKIKYVFVHPEISEYDDTKQQPIFTTSCEETSTIVPPAYKPIH